MPLIVGKATRDPVKMSFINAIICAQLRYAVMAYMIIHGAVPAYSWAMAAVGYHPNNVRADAVCLSRYKVILSAIFMVIPNNMVRSHGCRIRIYSKEPQNLHV